jgi:molybdopterin-guanine dinucleotide biosynthesis protein A
MTPSQITGLVLAGGQGSRMQGADKGLVEWQGQALALHALQRLRPQVGPLAISANRNLDVYASWNLPVWPDEDLRFTGPLAGLLAGLCRCETEWLATVPCDSPMFPPDLVSRLADSAARQKTLIAMAATRRHDGIDPQPVFLLVHHSLRDTLASAIAQDERRVRRWAQAQGCSMVVFDDAAAFANANTLEELAALPGPVAPGSR